MGGRGLRSTHGIQADIPSTNPGKGLRPTGTLALAATAVSDTSISVTQLQTSIQVERGYHMHLTGDYISDGSDFSSSKWLPPTDLYLDKINNDLTSDNWTAIFQALRCLKEHDTRDNWIQIGAPLPKLNVKRCSQLILQPHHPWTKCSYFLPVRIVETELEAPESSNRITRHALSSVETHSGVTIVLGTWIFHTFQTFTFTRLTFISSHDLRV